MPRFRPATPRPRAYGAWLLVVAAMVLAIVVVGGITRLTESGLSITEWKPVRGIIPPLTDAQWREEFDGYKAIPQYRAFNTGMTLAGFKQIYFWEYIHRLLARLIGLVLAGVLAVFWWRRWIPKGYGWRTLLILALGGLQGAIGWWMVASGLTHRTEVSHIRLAVHLMAAMLIYGVLIWTALDLLTGRRARLRLLPFAAILAIAVQLALGAFTAGLRAGYAFASWPKMGDAWLPKGAWMQGRDLAFNLTSNPVVVQFVHRWWAWIAAVLVILLGLRAARAGGAGRATALAVLVAVQIALGIATLLTGVALPIAVAHQGVGALLLGLTVAAAHAVGTGRTRRA
ncbi:COX15/CtaA family protein [Sphingomonas sp.]|uniref:COX15/CtaA family protein n=1 Tax=Sphingomonas sp. TaxID=28214 RepID=UPI003B3A705D